VGLQQQAAEERRKKAAFAFMRFLREVHRRARAVDATGMTHDTRATTS
jgi:hypothetical protein